MDRERQRERLVVGSVFATLLLAWLGFLIHRAPRFPGSALGSATGIAGAALMIASLAYPLAKRVGPLRVWLTPRISLPSLLAVHVYAGIVGALLAIVHTGHVYQSALGIALTALVLLVIVSGLAVRYLLAFSSHEIKEKLLLLETARGDLDHAWGVMEGDRSATPRRPGRIAALGAVGLLPSSMPPHAADVIRIAESVADLEYAVRTHEVLKKWFGRALVIHIVLSVFLCLLLAAHVAATIYFGLQWLR